MRTLADIKRRTTTGTRLEVIGQTKRPVLIGTVRTVTESTATRLAFTSSNTGADAYIMPWPKASAVRIIDADTWEYDLKHPASGHTCRLRFLPDDDTTGGNHR